MGFPHFGRGGFNFGLNVRATVGIVFNVGPVPVAEYWLDQLPVTPPGVQLACPRCGCTRWTAEQAAYGVKLACYECPTYLGVKSNGE